MQSNQRKLEFDPTPAGLVVALRKKYKSVWQTIKTNLLREHGAICQVCGRPGERPRDIHGHEVYTYTSNAIIKLERVVLLCWLCHDAVHFERTRRECGQAYAEKVASHYRTVNGNISREVFERDVEASFTRMLGIREFYGGPSASPELDFGPYKVGVDRLEAKRRSRLEVQQEDDEDGGEMLPDHENPMDAAMWRDCFR